MFTDVICAILKDYLYRCHLPEERGENGKGTECQCDRDSESGKRIESDNRHCRRIKQHGGQRYNE